MIDIRYHVISLVAVLLALGIGILLGTTLVERGLIAEQKSEIRSLRKTFDEIKNKNESLNADLGMYENFANQVKPYLIEGRLAGRPFAVITGEKPSEAVLGKIYEAIGAAGGSVPVTLTISGSKAYEDPNVINSLAALLQVPADAQTIRNRVMGEIANQLATASNPALLDELVKIGVVQVRGALAGPVSAGVIVDGIEPRSIDKEDIPLLQSCVGAGLPVIGVGGSGSVESVLINYKKVGISTVDHVETVPGLVAMVMVLQGKPGNYGSGKAAERLMP